MKVVQFDQVKTEIVAALLLVVFNVGAIAVTFSFAPPIMPGDPGSAFFPRLILAVMSAFTLIFLINRVMVKAGLRAGPVGEKFEFEPGGFFTTLGWLAGFLLLLPYAGFEISGFGFLFLLLGIRTGRWVWAGFAALISLILMYLVFVLLLKVHLPLLFLPLYLN